MYLINQERMDESIKIFKKIDKNNINIKIQYDYLKAYLDFFTGYPNFEVAKKVCEEYLTYPVLT